MDARELRLNNYVYVDNPHRPEIKNIPIRVVGLSLENDPADNMVKVFNSANKDSFGQLQEYIKPIPLTEELLLKCGFYTNGKRYEHVESKIILKFTTDNNYVVYYCGLRYGAIRCIDYLHHLQNLINALTGKDLTINL